MKTIRIVYSIILVLLIAIIFSFRYYRFNFFPRRLGQDIHVNALMKEVKKFNRSLQKNDTRAIYNLFNSSFRNETSFEEFHQAYLVWLNNRKFTEMKIQQVGASERTGFVACMLAFKNKPEAFLYQSWIKTGSGWKIVWLNRLLPREMLSYGENQVAEIQIIKNRTLHELFNNNLIYLIIGNVETPKEIFIEAVPNHPPVDYVLSNYTIRELPIKDIMKQLPNTDAFFWLEFATVRIIDDIASIYIDIHPMYPNLPGLSRTKGVQLYFIKQDNYWHFDSPGSHW